MPINPLVGIIRDTINSVSRVILPLILQVGTNVALILKLKRVGRLITNRSVSLKRERRFAITITILNTIYAIANVISMVSTLLINLYGYNESYVSINSYESTLAGFIYVCTQMIVMFVNCDLAFIVNIMSNKTFRREAKNVFRCKS